MTVIDTNRLKYRFYRRLRRIRRLPQELRRRWREMRGKNTHRIIITH